MNDRMTKIGDLIKSESPRWSYKLLQ